MAEDGLFDPTGRRGDTDRSIASTSSIPNSGVQSDDSAFYAFGDDWDLPPPMSTTFANFLHNKAGVPMEFVREFEQAALVWDMVSFMRWFSMGTTLDVAQRFGVEFCMKYPIQIAKLGVLYCFLKQHPLEKLDGEANESYDFSSFKRELWWPFMQMHRRHIKSQWDFSFNKVIQEATEAYNPDRTDRTAPTAQMEVPTKPRYVAPTDAASKTSGLTFEPEDQGTKEKEVKFQISSAEPNGATAFMDRIERREIGNGNIRYDESSRVKRNFISSDIKPWNGRWEIFPSLKNQIVAATLKVGMAHCTDEDVIKAYVASDGDPSTILEFPEYRTTISVRQFKSDIISFYGTLMEVFLRHGEDIVLKHRTSRDGIFTFNDLVTKFEMGGNKTLVLEKWQNFVTTTTYYDGYPNGMAGLASDFASHFTKIGEFDKELRSIYTETRKSSLLIRALRNEAPDWLVEHLKIHFASDFEGARNKLIEFEQLQDHSSTEMAIRTKKKGRLLHMTNMLEAVLEKELHEHNDQVEQLSVFANRVGREFNRDKFWIAPEIFRAIKPESKEDILRVKRELLTGKIVELEKEINSKQPRDHEPRLPAQYGRAQKVATNDDTDSVQSNVTASNDDDHTDPSDDDDLAALARALNTRNLPKRNIFVTRSIMRDDPTVRAHTEYYGAVVYNNISDTSTTIAIADSGADTTILDDNWLILTSMKACRLANLVGYDPGLGTKKGLPIVDAVALATTKSGAKVLIGIHEGVHNPGSPHTLISEFQVRNSGKILDSVARTHILTPDGSYGTQSLYHNADSLDDPIEFTLVNGLMSFEISKPSMEDFQSKPIHWLTANNKWQPSAFNDNKQYIPPLYASNLQQYSGRDESCGHIWNNDDDLLGSKEIEIIKRRRDVQRPLESTAMSEKHEPSNEIPSEVFVDTENDKVKGDIQCDDKVWNTKSLETEIEPSLYYFDPKDEAKLTMGNAFPTTLCTEHWSATSTMDERITQYDIDTFLANLTEDELSGHNLPFDILGYLSTAKAQAIRAKHKELSDADLQWMCKWLLRPLDVMRQTIGCTTRRLKAYFSYPMKKHYQARFPWITVSVFRLNEIVSTDPIFSSVKGLKGERCAQVFYGLTSHVINVYPMRSKKQFLNVYKEFVRDHGAPAILRRDNAMEQQSKEVLDFNRDLFIKNQFSEPGFQHQNPVESQAIRYLKQALCVTLDRSGAPENAWFFAAQHVAKIHNMTADMTLRDFITPYQSRFGKVPDISDLLAFRFWEPVYYLDSEESFPHSKEKKGYWAGTTTNIGDALTYWIVPENDNMDLCQPVPRSVVRSANDQNRENKRVPFHDDTTDIEMEAKMNRLFDSEETVTPRPPRQRRTKTIHNRKHRRNNRDNTSTVPFNRDEGGDGNILIKGDSPFSYESDEPGAGPGDGTLSEPGIGTLQNNQTHTHPKIVTESRDKTAFKAIDGTTFDPNIVSLESVDNRGEYLRRSERLKNQTHHKWKPVCAAAIRAATTSTLFVPTVATTEFIPIQISKNRKPLEQEFSFIGLTTKEQQQMMEMQLIDSMSKDEETSPWDIIEITSHRVARNPRTRGGKTTTNKHLRLKAKFSDGTVSWVQADAVRSDSPFPVVQYAARKHLTDHKWFSWTKAYIQDGQKLDNMRQAFQAVVNKAPKYKFGVEVPHSPRHALYLDKVNGNNLWEESMQKEFQSLNQHETFRVLHDRDHIPTEYKRIPYHIVFDVKFDLRRKSRLVAGGNWCDPPKEDVYSGVVALDTVRLGFLLGAMNNLSVCAADVGTAFLYGKTTEKVYVIAGPEFGTDIAGKRMVIDKGLYGLRSSSARFHEHLSTKLRNLGYLPSKADSDFWYRDAGDHYEYLATYVDDILVYSRKPMETIEELKKHYVLKGIGVPEYYLGGNVEEVQERSWNEKRICTALSAKTYIESSTKRLEELVGKQFPKQATPMLEAYHPELDESPLLDAATATKYRAILGSAGWCVTLGRFDVAYATNTLARYSMAPRQGHYKQAQRIFGYLSNPAFTKGRLLIDPNPHTITDGLIKDSKKYDWTEFYPDATEELPPTGTVPIAKGPKAQITVYVDADHAHDQVTRRSVTGILVFVNNTLIRAYTKRQRTVETSTYGSELVASRIATEMVMEYRFALRSLGVEVDGPAIMLGDNNAVILNTTLPSSQLKKKHQAIAYHRVREAIASRILEFHHIPSWANYSDVMTKPVSAQVFHAMVKPVLFRTNWKEIQNTYYANECQHPNARVGSALKSRNG